MQVFDSTRCELGEGILWHPERRQVFWVDILSRRLHMRDGDDTQVWAFSEMVTSCGWIDRDRLLLASETGLWVFDLRDGTKDRLAAIEADNPATRSNDGRADPWGGFWIGTMGKDGEEGAGALYRWYRGEVRLLRRPMTTPNAMAFDLSRRRAYVSDTSGHVVWVHHLDAEGWPVGDPQVFLDLREEGMNPDGGTVDAEGRFWSAQWGAGRIACYGPDGTFMGAKRVPTPLTSCPTFGGTDLETLFVTTAQEGMSAEDRARHPQAGMTFCGSVSIGGRPVRGLDAPSVQLA